MVLDIESEVEHMCSSLQTGFCGPSAIDKTAESSASTTASRVTSAALWLAHFHSVTD